MSKYYNKAKKYVIRPSCRKEVLGFIEENFKGSKYEQAFKRVLENHAMTFKRWMYYFDFDFLDDKLMEEDCVEIVEKDDLGI